MKGGTLAVDKNANAIAHDFNSTQNENDGSFKGWGLLSGASIPLDHAIERQHFFRHEIERTLTQGPKVPFQDDDTISKSAALKTQKEMLENYTSDINIMPGADQQYGMFVPLANMALHSAAKTDAVGKQLGVSTDDMIGNLVDKKHAAALKQAVIAEKMQQGDSISAKSTAVASARKGMVSASAGLRMVMNQQVIKKLNAEKAEKAEEKKKIEEKIEKVEKWCGYAEKAVGLIAGGAGAVAGAAPLEAGAAAAEEAGISNNFTELKEGSEKVEKGVGIAVKIVGGVMTLYYEDQVRALKATMEGAASEIKGWDMANEALALEQAQAAMDKATADYHLAVQNYEAAINDRRMHMANAGAVADSKVGGNGKDQKNSQAMLWIESVLETQSLVATAKAAGTDAKAKLDDVRKQVVAHRTHSWSNIEDIWGNGGGADREEGTADGDVKALAKMSRLTDNWLTGATEAEKYLDKSVGTSESNGAAGTLAKSGYSGPV